MVVQDHICTILVHDNDHINLEEVFKRNKVIRMDFEIKIVENVRVLEVFLDFLVLEDLYRI